MNRLEKILSKNYIDFLKKNKININKKKYFNQDDYFFEVKKFYNISDYKVLSKLNNDYEGRIPAGLFIIADVDNGDYLLMNQKGSVLFWNHEINDLGYDIEAEYPCLVSLNIMIFLDCLEEDPDFNIKPDVISIKLSDDFNDLFKDYLE